MTRDRVEFLATLLRQGVPLEPSSIEELVIYALSMTAPAREAAEKGAPFDEQLPVRCRWCSRPMQPEQLIQPIPKPGQESRFGAGRCVDVQACNAAVREVHRQTSFVGPDGSFPV